MGSHWTDSETEVEGGLAAGSGVFPTPDPCFSAVLPLLLAAELLWFPARLLLRFWKLPFCYRCLVSGSGEPSHANQPPRKYIGLITGDSFVVESVIVRRTWKVTLAAHDFCFCGPSPVYTENQVTVKRAVCGNLVRVMTCVPVVEL